jgi:hypothetical protein
MPAGKHGSSEVIITLDDAGGTPRTITNFVLTVGALKITSNMQKSDAFGDAWEEMLPTGKQKVDPIKLTGFFDDTPTTGPHVVMGAPDASPQSATRTLAVVVGNAKTFTVECFLSAYSVLPKNGALTEFEADLQPSGAAAWT